MAQVITIDGIDVTNSVPLESLRIEEVVDSRAQCSFTVEDFANSITVGMRSDVKITDGGSTIFRGAVLSRAYVVRTGYRDIALNCGDYSLALDERLVGVPGGAVFLGPDAQGNYVTNDPNGNSTATDKTTVRDLFAAYVANPTIEASTYVNEYVSNVYLGTHIVYWNRTTLRSALSDLASIAGPNLHYWIDPDLHFHWQMFPLSAAGVIASGGPLVLLFPEDPVLTAAPFGVAEDASVDYLNFYGAQDPPGLQLTYDGMSAVQQAYITGSTDFVYTPTGTLTVTLPIAGGIPVTLVQNVPVVQGGGAGWYPYSGAQGEESNDPSKRQALVSSEASTLAERSADGAAAIAYGSREIVRGSCVIRVPTGTVHVGQSFRVRFPTSLGIDAYYPVQKVTTQYLDGTGRRDITVEWGDASQGRLTQRRVPKTVTSAGPSGAAARPATQLEIGVSDVNPKPNSVQPFTVTVQAPAGVAWEKVFSQSIELRLFYFTTPYVTPMTSPPASISPTSVKFADTGATSGGGPGTIHAQVTFTAAALDGDIAYVAAFMQDTP